MKQLTYLAAILFSTLSFGQSSVLSSGSWFKVGVTETGVYRLNRSDLASLGISVGSLDPSQIQIFGNSFQGVLPQRNDEARPADLLENAIYVHGGEDGTFNEGDYVLFFAVGPDKQEWSDSGLIYENNFYADTSYYFIRVGQETGKRLETQTSPGGTGVDVSTFDDAIIFEEDVVNLLSSGRGWYGELIGNNSTVSHDYSIQGLASNPVLRLSVISQSPEDNSFEVSANGVSLGSIPLSSIPSGVGTTYNIKARDGSADFTLEQNTNLDLDFRYVGNASTGRGFIDYYTIEFKRDLVMRDAQHAFRHVDNIGELLRFTIGNAAAASVWNVTDPINVIGLETEVNGAQISFQSQSGDIEEFVVFDEGGLSAPTLFGPVANQNLRGDVNYEAVIVSDDLFADAAETLAQFHREHDGLAVKVVSLLQIYNEFSSGRQDVSAIRDYAKYVFDNGGQLRYLLLFGDCSFDYKYRETNNTNFVPTYESRDSFHPIFSYSSDDYFGFFEEAEGEWVETAAGDHTLEIGVGRLPAKSRQEAEEMVEKIIYYSTSPNTLGKWRNQIAYLADDGDTNDHVEDVEWLAELVDTTYSQYRIEKILLDAFDQEVGADQTESSPQTTRALKARIKEGTFSLNFMGHGNESQWMHEKVLTEDLIETLTNRNKLPIFVTATCEFGRYDDPGVVSGAEQLLLRSSGGAIALLTTSRPVFASTNFELNEAFHQNIFRKQDGKFLRLGDIIRITKNEGLAGRVNRNFTLLGDPMMMPAFPSLDVVVNELQNQTDTLSALEQITYTGRIEEAGVIRSDFNGILDVVVFDEKQAFRTKGQDSAPFDYTVRNNSIFRGQASVESGTFSFTFRVPKSISYQFNSGKMSLYAWDEDLNIDASGSSRTFVMGGTDNAAEDDFLPPLIEMYLNDESFQNGGVVGGSSLFIANLSDESGITTTGNGLVQGITLELNGEVINLNQFYSADLDSYQSGTVVYPIQDLEPGRYTAILRVHDTHNNLAEDEIIFTVSENSFISLFNTAAYPNPVRGSTTFSFEHDREEEDLAIGLLIYNSRGEVVNKSDYEFLNSDRLVEIPWEATTDTGSPLNQGIYFYRLIIRSRLDGATKEISSKLVIIN